MTLWLENEGEYSFDFSCEDIAAQVIRETMH